MNAVDLTAYRASAAEQERVTDLLRLLPERGGSILEIGVRDGYITHLLAQCFGSVVALDLECPRIERPNVTCVQGDVTRLEFADRSFDYVLCAEVLEHIPSDRLRLACSELSRVARKALVIGVPYRQDLRLGRTVCAQCGRINPPWGHVNSFDERDIESLFASWRVAQVSYVGKTRERTNFLSAFLMNLAGNPYGTYEQDERCVHCAAALGGPRARTFAQRVATRIAWNLSRTQQRLASDKPKWMHAQMTRPHAI